LTQLGELSLWIALLMAAWCATLAAQGALMRRRSLTESGARGLYVSSLFTALAAAGLAAAFLGDDYSVRYVAMHSSSNVETLYKLCAFWSGGGGELLLASLMIGAAGSCAAFVAQRRDADHVRAAWTVSTLGLLAAAFLAATAFKQNPFAPVARMPDDGRGLDPIFRNPLMALQPPLMLLGAACAASPLALVVAAMVRRRFDRALLAGVRASAAVSWGLLSAGLLLGARWAYVSPGLRALRAGSPAVIASASIWLVLTLFLIAIEFRGAGHATSLAPADLTRRRVARIVAAVGAALCLIMLAARPLTKDYDAQIGDGEQYRAKDAWGRDWTFTSQGASRLERPGDDVTAVALLPTRGGVRQPFVTSESRQYYGAGGLDVFPAQTVPGIRGTIAQDLFVMLSDAGNGRAVLRISFRPLVELVWAGGVLLTLGGLLLFWPPREEHAT
jgi:cytochrome c biogenesis factor